MMTLFRQPFTLIPQRAGSCARKDGRDRGPTPGLPTMTLRRRRRHLLTPPTDADTLRRIYWRSCLGYLALHVSGWFLLVVLASTVLHPVLGALPAPGTQHALDTWFLRTGAFITFGVMVVSYALHMIHVERRLGIRP